MWKIYSILMDIIYLLILEMFMIAAVNCSSPHSIFNGSHGTPSNTSHGGTVTYSCNNGYTLSGSATVSCLATGEWSTRPVCTGKTK